MKYVKKITGWVFGILFFLVTMTMDLTHLMRQKIKLSELTDHFDTTGFQPVKMPQSGVKPDIGFSKWL